MLLGGVALAALAGGAGWAARGSIHNEQLGKNFAQRLGDDRYTAISREQNLWSAVGNANRAQRELIDRFKLVNEVSAEARQKMIAAMDREREAVQAAEDLSRQMIKELGDAKSQLATDWKTGVIPPDITCGVFVGSGCPKPAYPATGADPGGGVEVRDGRAPAPEGSPSDVPRLGSSDDQ